MGFPDSSFVQIELGCDDCGKCLNCRYPGIIIIDPATCLPFDLAGLGGEPPPPIDLSGLGAAGLFQACDENGVDIFVCFKVDEDTGEKVFFLSTDPSTPLTENVDFFPCAATKPCSPWSAGFTADEVPAVEPYNQVDVHNPTCCKLTVTTSAGTLVVPPLGSMCSPRYDCPPDRVRRCRRW